MNLPFSGSCTAAKIARKCASKPGISDYSDSSHLMKPPKPESSSGTAAACTSRAVEEAAESAAEALLAPGTLRLSDKTDKITSGLKIITYTILGVSSYKGPQIPILIIKGPH